MDVNTTAFLMPREPAFRWRYFRAKPSDSRAISDGRIDKNLFFWARNALFRALDLFRVPSTAHVLVPAYICRAAVEPFEAYGLTVDFYGINRDCQIDVPDLTSKILPQTRVLLVAHYFGFPQDIERLRTLCSTNNLLLFEDCAHVLPSKLSGRPLGSFGDASVFSYRKFLPMFDGAELAIPARQPIETGLHKSSQFSMRAARHIASFALDSSSGLPARAVKGALQATRSIRQTGAAQTQEPGQNRVDNNSVSFDVRLASEPITPASLWVLRHSDIPRIVERRRQNFMHLGECLAEVGAVRPLYNELLPGVCPWVFPVVFNGLQNPHLLLREKGIPAVTWGGVRPSGISPREFGDADFLYDNLVFLPIHQDLSAEQINFMARVVAQVGALQPVERT
jgi:perosamine synthetase